ncbi:MAG: hypothetical protein Q7J84_03910 [Sulfuricaulis sp.]|nr:hypothetical protein [Sulfuricaulis sp.]
MPNELFSERNLVINGLAPMADAFAATVYSDIVDISEAHQLTFLVWWGVGAAGTTTLTVEASDDISAGNVSAVAFRSRRINFASSDVIAAVTARAAAGFATTAGSNQMYLIEVDPQVLAASGYKYARLKCVESVDAELLGGILVILSDLRVQKPTPDSMID